MASQKLLCSSFLQLGCDGSVLLNSTKKTKAEKNEIPNLGIRGFHVIDDVKAASEKKCLSVVSCADILAMVTGDAIAIIHGPYWEVPMGRRDRRVSTAAETFANLPPPFAHVTLLKQRFAARSLKVLVVLSGRHTIGTSHCSSFNGHLYNFTAKGITDPTSERNCAVLLKKKCKPGDTETLVEMDPGSFKTFDDDYYTLVAKRRGLFESGAALLEDEETRAYVNLQSATHGSTLAKDFAESMVKMGQIVVLTGKAGEIIKHCAFVN